MRSATDAQRTIQPVHNLTKLQSGNAPRKANFCLSKDSPSKGNSPIRWHCRPIRSVIPLLGSRTCHRCVYILDFREQSFIHQTLSYKHSFICMCVNTQVYEHQWINHQENNSHGAYTRYSSHPANKHTTDTHIQSTFIPHTHMINKRHMYVLPPHTYL